MISSQAALALDALQAGGFGLADPFFDAGVLAMAQFQSGELTRYHAVRGVGEKPGDAVPVGIGERQLRAGMRAFLAQDQPRVGRPGRQIPQIGGLADPGAFADATVGADRRIPSVAGGKPTPACDTALST